MEAPPVHQLQAEFHDQGLPELQGHTVLQLAQHVQNLQDLTNLPQLAQQADLEVVAEEAAAQDHLLEVLPEEAVVTVPVVGEHVVHVNIV